MDKEYGNLAASIGSTMKPFTSIILFFIFFHQYYFNKTFSPLEGFYIFRMLGFPVPWFVNNHMHSCKSLDKPAKQAKMLTGGFELKCSFHAQETYQLEP